MSIAALQGATNDHGPLLNGDGNRAARVKNRKEGLVVGSYLFGKIVDKFTKKAAQGQSPRLVFDWRLGHNAYATMVGCILG